MTTVALLMDAVPSVVRPAWCSRANLGQEAFGILWEPKSNVLTLEDVAKRLDEAAQLRGWSVGEVARVRKGEFEGVYARKLDIPLLPAPDPEPAT